MGLFFNNTKGGMMDVIRCDESDYLIWKWHPKGSTVGGTKRENSIRWGSSLRVKEGSVAVFLHSNEHETIRDYIEGPADVLIDTKNLPFIAAVIGLAYNGDTPFQAEVYFINLANTIQMKFAVPYFDVFDSKLSEFSVPIAVRGSFDFNITDYQYFIKIHRLDNFSMRDLQVQVRDAIIEHVKNVVANAPDFYEMPVLQIEKKTSSIKEKILEHLSEKLFNDYGVTLKDINLVAIEIDKNSEGYQELQSVTKDLTAEALKNRSKAKNIVERRDIIGTQALGMFDKVVSKVVDIKETQFVRHKKAQTDYADAIENERAGRIGAVGGKFLRNIGNIVHGAGVKNSTPPPIPGSFYNVAVNGEVTGPYDLDILAQMARKQQFNADSLVWKTGMKEWVQAGDIEELQVLFAESISESDG